MAGGDDSKILRGFSTSVSPLVADLLAKDSGDVPAVLLSTGNYLPKEKKVPLSRYYDRAFAELERERLWKKVWQFACREEDIPNVGDRVSYTVGMLSFVILRSAPNEFRAFNNACLHRGTRLCDGQGSGESLRCPFHAWEWKLDGSLKNIPSRWDFPQVSDAQYKLPEAKIGTWGGYIFINPDPNAGPLSDALGVLPEHFKRAPVEDRFTVIHIRKKVRANWKITMEAFLEAYHVIETHSDSLGFTGDASTQYAIWDDGKSHISRLITPLGIPSPHLGEQASPEAAGNMTFQALAMAMPGVPVPKVDMNSALPPRAQIAAWRRQMMSAALGRDFSTWADTMLVDTIEYHMFPNFCPWFADGLPLVYQFLPDGDDPNVSVMNVRLTLPLPAGGVRPTSPPIVHLDYDEPFNTKPEIGLLSIIFDQDMSNLPRIQLGLKAAADGHAFATFGRYQEQRIAHFHEVLEKTLGI